MSRRRSVLAALAGAAIVLVVGRAIAALYVEFAWRTALGLPSLARASLAGELVLRGGTTLAATLFLFANLYGVRRSIVSLVLPQRVGDLEFGEEVPSRYLAGTAAVLAIIIGSFLGVSGEAWPLFALALGGARFGERDPYFEHDLGFYVAQLPAELTLFAWAQRLLIVTVIAVALLYALTPSIRWRGRTLYVSEYVRRHLTVLGGILLLLFAWAFRLESYQMLLNGSGAGGAFAAIDLQVRIPGTLVLAATSLAAGLIVLWAGSAGQVRLAFFAVTVMLLLTVVVRYVLPAAMSPRRSGTSVQAPYIATRDGFTRRAFGADRVPPGAGRTSDTARLVTRPQGVAVWEAAALRRAIDGAAGVGWQRSGDQLLAIIPQRGFIEGGEATPWTVVRVAAWTADGAGEPVSVRASAGESSDVLAPVIAVDSAPAYRLVADPAGVVHGASAGPWLARLAHAWALQNFRIMLGRHPDQAETIVLRPLLRERLNALAPFFVQGAIPRPAIAADSIFWTVDLYAASGTYPLSEGLVAAGAERRYLHPAGHAIVNSATGVVRILPVEDPDPLVRAWMRRFPELFADAADVPQGVGEALMPHTEAARARAIVFARLGTSALNAPPGRRHLAVEHGADSVLAGDLAPVVVADAAGLSVAIPILDERDRVAGLLLASGPNTQTEWLPAGNLSRGWGEVLDALRAADSTSARRDARLVRGRVRVVPTSAGLLYAQPTFLWPVRGGPRLATVNSIGPDGVRTGPSLQMAAGAAEADERDMAPPADPRALFLRMRDALRRSDWNAFGAAMDTLGRVLGAPPR